MLNNLYVSLVLLYTLCANRNFKHIRAKTVLTVRHLEFEKETAGLSTHTVGSRILHASAASIQPAPAPVAERSSSETQGQLVEAIFSDEAKFSAESLHQQVNFCSKISGRRKISRRPD